MRRGAPCSTAGSCRVSPRSTLRARTQPRPRRYARTSPGCRRCRSRSAPTKRCSTIPPALPNAPATPACWWICRYGRPCPMIGRSGIIWSRRANSRWRGQPSSSAPQSPARMRVERESMSTARHDRSAGAGRPRPDFDVLVIGCGFAGICMGIHLRRMGLRFAILERASDIGGTWRDNTYPGCACDIPSHLYSFSFELNPDWTHAYSPWEEIRDYLRRCAKDYSILPHIQWNTELLDACWNEDESRW